MKLKKPINNDDPGGRIWLRAGGWAWLAAGSVYLLGEAVSASVFRPAYSYAGNYISDLGVAECGVVFQGRSICSPLHDVMNVAFILNGTLFLLGAVLVNRVLKQPRPIWVLLTAVHAFGLWLVGLVHGSAATAADGAAGLHMLGAILAIGCGNLAVWFSPDERELGIWPMPIRLRRILPPIGLVAAGILFCAGRLHVPLMLPDGVWERCSVYTITLWQIATGLRLLRRAGWPAGPAQVPQKVR